MFGDVRKNPGISGHLKIPEEWWFQSQNWMSVAVSAVEAEACFDKDAMGYEFPKMGSN